MNARRSRMLMKGGPSKYIRAGSRAPARQVILDGCPPVVPSMPCWSSPSAARRAPPTSGRFWPTCCAAGAFRPSASRRWRALRAFRRRVAADRDHQAAGRGAASAAGAGGASTCRSTSACATGIRCWPTRSRTMAADGVRRAIGFIAAAHRSYSSCTQYRENVVDATRRARRRTGYADVDGDVRRRLAHAPRVHRRPTPRMWPRRSRRCLPRCASARGWSSPRTASRPRWPARRGISEQLAESARLVAERLGHGRLGAGLPEPQRTPGGPVARARRLRLPARAERASGLQAAVLCPIGFVCDHIEVLYDLDHEAAAVCREIGLPMARAAGRQRRSAVPGHDGRRGPGDLDPLQRRTAAADRRTLGP